MNTDCLLTNEEKQDDDSDKPPLKSSKLTSASSTDSLYGMDIPKNKKTSSIDDYEIVEMLGKGSYAKVELGRNIYTNNLYAIKNINKTFVQRQEKVYEAHLEKYMLTNLNHQNIIKLYSTFQDREKLYFVLEYCPNRDLSHFIKYNNSIPSHLIKFYIAELVNALEYLHSKGLCHRDLKPENIVLDKNYNLKIVDFATSHMAGMKFDKKKMKFIPNDNNEIYNGVLIGTPEYIAPETLQNKSIGIGVDLWALGCILYLFIHGRTPFHDKTDMNIFENILNKDVIFNNDIDDDSKDLINRLLNKNPELRLGCGKDDFESLKKHPFFNDIDWNHLHKMHPPLDYRFNNSSYNQYNEINETPLFIKKKLLKLKDIIPFKIDLLSNYEDKILIEGIVYKKSPWLHYNKRILKIYSSGKVEYLEPISLIIKRTIYLDIKSNVLYKDNYTFDIITSERTFIFKVSHKVSKVWVDIINEVIYKFSYDY